MKLSIGFSPCPNDTFIFDALVNGKIDTGELEFEPYLEDVETLNNWAADGRLDVTKLSFPALFRASGQYAILSSGAALGKGVGPLLVAKKVVDQSSIENGTIAIPGENTTANFLLSYAFPGAKHRVPTLFSNIEDAVLNEEVDMGVIIHENRFTYAQKGLVKMADLGEVWESREGVPIPLGCIAVKRTLPVDVRTQIDSLIRSSLTHSFATYPLISDYTKKHAQEMDEAVMRQHIELYVNNYSMDLGDGGRKAVTRLFEVYKKQTSHQGAASALFT